jgi:hypothetical protein
VTTAVHPEWTPARLARLHDLADSDAAYLSTLRRPWRGPAPRPVLTPAEVTAAAAGLESERERRGGARWQPWPPATCKACRRTIGLISGVLVPHGPFTSRCPGSGRHP